MPKVLTPEERAEAIGHRPYPDYDPEAELEDHADSCSCFHCTGGRMDEPVKLKEQSYA